jgi:hypothetical protein
MTVAQVTELSSTMLEVPCSKPVRDFKVFLFALIEETYRNKQEPKS